MGGMLGMSFALMYPEAPEELAFENSIGRKDYGVGVPFQRWTKLNELS